MSAKPALRRLIDLPGVADLEFKALMKPRYADPEARAEFPELDACSTALFGLTADEADAVPRPADWDGIEDKPTQRQVAAFEAAGWDVTDNKLRPLRLLGQFNAQLWLAIRGVAGTLPFVPDDEPDPGKSALALEAARFQRNRR
jgi:hypothetical protein